MKEHFNEYFTDISISDVMKGRIQEIYDELVALYSMEIDDVFLCDIATKNGDKDYVSLWFFSNNHIIECKDFISQDDFDITALRNNVLYFNIRKKKYNTNQDPSSDSSAAIDVLVNSGRVSVGLMATGKNCAYLKDIAKKYLLPNMISIH